MSLYSPIFPPNIAPARPGLYLTSFYKEWEFVGLHRWDGKNWYDASGKGGQYHLLGGQMSEQNRYWRGLSRRSKEGPSS